jgi:hypothetical protein
MGAMCRKEVRTLAQSLTLHYDKVIFILDPTEQTTALAGQKVIVCDYPDGRLEIMHESFVLPYRTFDTLRWFTGRLWLRTSDWTTCCHSLPRYRKVAI